MNIEQIKEHSDRAKYGEMANRYLESAEWKDLVKPILDSMVKGLIDVRDIKKSMLTSNKKAEIIVEARATAAEYIEGVERLIREYVSDGKSSEKLLEQGRRRQETPDPLIKVS